MRSVCPISLRYSSKLNGDYTGQQHKQCVKANVLYQVAGAQLSQNNIHNLL